MDLGALELQVFVSLTVILGAAFVALVCDYLKGHNEQLREQNIELRSRRDEQERIAVLDPVRWLESFGDRTRQAPEEHAHEVLSADRWPPPRPVLVAAEGVRAQFTEIHKEPEPAVIVPEIVEQPARFYQRSTPAVDDHWSVAPPPPPREILSLEEIQEAIQSRPVARPQPEKEPVTSSSRKPGLAIGEELKQILKRSFGRGRSPAKAVESMMVSTAEPVATDSSVEHETLTEKTSIPDRTTESIEILDRIVGRPTQPAQQPEPAVVTTESKPSSDSISAPPEIVARVEYSAEPPLNPQPSVSFVPAPPEESVTEAVTPIRPLPAPPEAIDEPEIETPSAPPVEPLIEALSHTNDAATIVGETAPLHAGAAIPAGFHDTKVLAGLIDSGVQVEGVVFALGITDYKRVQESQGQQALDDLVAAVRVMIVDMIGENDFAVRASEDCFVLVFKNESGAAAQRRINQVSERLWDFQLRSLGVSSILFSWGAVEVKDESLKNAIAAANERLEQSRRSRKGSPGTTKRVVNG